MSEKELFVKMTLSAWTAQNERVDKLIATLSDEKWMSEVAPGRNRGIYLLGHLTAVNDGMLKLLGFGEKLYPELETMFLKSKDKTVADIPSITDIKKYWKTVNEELLRHFNTLSATAWFEKHTAVSEADFAKEPHRNRLNVLIGRSIHQGYHLGQLAFLESINQD